MTDRTRRQSLAALAKSRGLDGATRDCAKQYEQWLAQDHATIADLRDRLRVLAPMVCEGCGCAVATHKLAAAPTRSGLPSCASVCYDCYNTEAAWEWWDCSSVDVMCACISVGLRALCGRRLLDGCDTTKGGE